MKAPLYMICITLAAVTLCAGQQITSGYGMVAPVPPEKMCALFDPPPAGCPKPEPMDVPAVEEEYVAYQTHENCRSASDDPACHTESYDVTAPASCYLMQCDTVDHKENLYTCADKRRVLLTDEAGGKHCILFPPQVKP